MVIDSSAVMAVLLGESEAARVAEVLEQAPERRIGAPTLLELMIVTAARFGDAGRGLIEQFLAVTRADVVPFDLLHTAIAFDAWRRFGKGNHAAGLNFGDCLTYAVAKVADEPLLYVGDDFARTDIVPALAPA